MKTKLPKKALKATCDAILISGGTAAVAESFGVCSEAVRKWKSKGVPPKHVVELVGMARLKGMSTTYHSIRPDTFPEGV
jgi:hypothetical protein